MANDTFRTQIEEDISYYRELRPFLDNVDKSEWTFNLWVLDKLFGEDLDVAISHVIDYHDAGIDCFVWHEETNDLYLIQNKYYDASTSFTASYFNENVDRAYQMLLDGNYKHCPELQQLFNNAMKRSDFRVYHYFYVTNNNRNPKVDLAVQKFNQKKIGMGRTAQVLYLDDIQEAFYDEPIVDSKSFSTRIFTINGSTVLSVDNKNFHLNFEIDAKYVMLPVVTLYNLLRSAEQERYPIFDANIREYLGKGRAVNKGIIKTLESETERSRFFFYNNGITITCSSMKMENQTKRGRPLVIENPQIVNGCQTVSSIQQVLSAYPESDLAEEFKDTFVMAKVLIIPEASGDDDHYEELRKNIVRFNNSQNSIDEKNFAANESFFRTVQREFEAKGFLVLLKQSDREKYSNKYKGKVDQLRKLADTKVRQFGLEGKVKNLRDFMVPLDKLMQIILAFVGDSQQASQKKGALLKKDSAQWNLVTGAIKNDNDLTTHRMLDLYLLYLRSEYEKTQNKKDNRVPVTWFLIEGFSRYECDGADFSLVGEALETREKVDSLISLYTGVSKLYLAWYIKNHDGRGYNDMIKEKLDYKQFEDTRDTVITMF